MLLGVSEGTVRSDAQVVISTHLPQPVVVAEAGDAGVRNRASTAV